MKLFHAQVALTALFFQPTPGFAATLTTLANFGDVNDDDGPRAPLGGLTADASGNLYGTSLGGGIFGAGSVFRLATNGTLTTIASFEVEGSTGNSPEGGLVADSLGRLYGATVSGGDTGLGTVFRVTPEGTLTTLANFDSTAFNPYGSGGLVVDASNTVYGTTTGGGDFGGGTVYRVTPGGTLTILASFDGPNGAFPNSGLVADASGILYGTTTFGGAFEKGTVFSLTTAGTLTTLASFNGANGEGPLGGVIVDAAGILYGTTANGGSNTSLGTVFKLTTDGNLTTLAEFGAGKGFNVFQGANLVIDAAGTLYGTTTRGGLFDGGTVYSVTKDGLYSTLVNFGGLNGVAPQGSLIFDASGSLYGTTLAGGSFGSGTIFRIDFAGTSAVPEPENWALLVVGFGMVGALARRRQRVPAQSVSAR